MYKKWLVSLKCNRMSFSSNLADRHYLTRAVFLFGFSLALSIIDTSLLYAALSCVYKLSRNRNLFVCDNCYRTCTVIVSNRTSCACPETARCIVCTYAHCTYATHAKRKLQIARYLFRSVVSTSKVKFVRQTVPRVVQFRKRSIEAAGHV